MIINDSIQEEVAPLSLESYFECIDALGPFERAPHIAVAVSGGRDSMALCLLAYEWAKQIGGRVCALTVDHQLRPESAAEAVQTNRWLSNHGIEHHVLTWRGPKPTSGVQAAARQARYELMEDWCRQNGVLHLFLGHHKEDQAETVLFRLSHDSGLDGLAGMSAIREQTYIRLLRPFLNISRRHLAAYLQSREQAWIEDPSNTDLKYARTGLRQMIEKTDNTDQNITVEDLTKLANRCARARLALEENVARMMARCCTLDLAGYARLDVALMRTLPSEISLRILSRAIRCIGGKPFGPKQSPLERLHQVVINEQLRRSRTLGGCLLSSRDGELFVFREQRHLPAPQKIDPGKPVLWDDRFSICLDQSYFEPNRKLWLETLGRAGRQIALSELGLANSRKLPVEAICSLPAVHDQAGIAYVPHLNFMREDLMTAPLTIKNVVFRPPEGLGDRGFVGLKLHEQRDILSL